MYSLNVPVPPHVARLAAELARELPDARPRARGEHTLVCKRLGTGDDQDVERLIAQARATVTDTPPFDVHVTGIGQFESPTTGTGPVVYLVVESPALVSLHHRLCDVFDPVPHLEGEAYDPHVTIARGGTLEAARRLTDRDVDPVSFTVTSLVVWDAERALETTRLNLAG